MKEICFNCKQEINERVFYNGNNWCNHCYTKTQKLAKKFGIVGGIGTIGAAAIMLIIMIVVIVAFASR